MKIAISECIYLVKDVGIPRVTPGVRGFGLPHVPLLVSRVMTEAGLSSSNIFSEKAEIKYLIKLNPHPTPCHQPAHIYPVLLPCQGQAGSCVLISLLH